MADYIGVSTKYGRKEIIDNYTWNKLTEKL